ncbi:MAG: DUF711 family protein [Rhodothermales bacterium]|nr:DUF711 family protein [Rhodothermales bacterium]
MVKIERLPVEDALAMNELNRRRFLGLAGAATAGFALDPTDGLASLSRQWDTLPPAAPEFRIRTITTGIRLRSAVDHGAMQEALDFLGAARDVLAADYEVQTIRIATLPLASYTPEWRSDEAIDAIAALDRMAADADVMFSVGPVLTGDQREDGFGTWASELISATTNTSFSAFIASETGGRHPGSIRASAEAIAAIARTSPGGEGNFRFCATAFCPPGTPFFPAAWHAGAPAFSIGLESPNLLLSALRDASDASSDGLDTACVRRTMIDRLNSALAPIDEVCRSIASGTDRRYLGIDTSPAPGLDASIGEVIETLSGAPFGSPATLSACSTITDVLQGLDTRTFGYSGLMLPVLEDRVLAERASELRYGLQDLLLYSSVCGTGLDVVPLPGNVSVEALEAIIGDVAALALRYRKPLSARLFPIPGKSAGEMAHFENPFLTSCRVMEAT